MRPYSLSRYAAWRRRPASEKQLDVVKTMRGVKPEQVGAEEITILGKTVKLQALTAGEVSSYL